MRYYHSLLDDSKSFVCKHMTTLPPIKDSSLYISLSHAVPSHTMNILSSDTTTKNGVMILWNLQSKVLISKTTDSVDKMHVQWCGIKSGDKEYVEVYTARALTFQSELKETIKDFTKEELVQKWRQGIGLKNERDQHCLG